MMDLQGPQVLLGSRAFQAAAFFPKETQALMASQGYQAVKEIGVSQGLQGLRATRDLQDRKVREVLMVL